MKYLRVCAVIAAVTLLFTAIFIITGRREIRTDTIYTNDIVQTVKESMSDLSVLTEKYPDEDIMVFDTAGKCIYPVNTDLKLNDVQEGRLCLAVTDGSVYYGTAVIPDPDAVQYEMAYERLCAGAVMLLSVMMICAAVFYIYLRRDIIRPFSDLLEFAGKIAVGDLDSPLIMEKNNVFGKFTESFDIMREELKASRERENALKLKERELMASLSHDIKTPLSGIKIICDVLSVKVNDDYVLSKVSTIGKKTDEINMLVSDLLTASLDDMGELTVDCTDEDSSVLREIVTAADPRELVHQGEIPECLISIDKKRMLQIISNVIGNSYKYADTPIDISYSISSDYLNMSISDHGKGVPADELPFITNRFYRGKDAKDKSGSGLGLYIASELMGRMKGELICSSRGEGLTIMLMILLS